MAPFWANSAGVDAGEVRMEAGEPNSSIDFIADADKYVQ